MKSTLVVYYSRNWNTKIVAESIAEKIDWDIDEIVDLKDRSGLRWYLLLARDANQKKLTKIKKTNISPSDYKTLIIGSPVQNWTIAPAVRTYLTEQLGQLPENISFFCTQNSDEYRTAFLEMADIISKTPKETISIREKNIKKNIFEKDLDAFVSKIK